MLTVALLATTVALAAPALPPDQKIPINVPHVIREGLKGDDPDIAVFGE